VTESSTVALIEELNTDIGQALIRAADELDALKARDILARDFPEVHPELLRMAIDQAHLRRRARARFAAADQLWWTHDGLEQASRPAASTYRAQQAVQSHVDTIVDLTCGVGLDLLAFAEAGLSVIGIERDPVTAELARRNAQARGVAGRVQVITGSCADSSILAELPRDAAWFIDPARRTTTRRADGSHVRLTDPEQWSPSWSWVTDIAATVGTANGPQLLIAKTSPAISHQRVSTGATDWLSVDGDVVDATVWWGRGEPGSRCAALLGTRAVEQSQHVRVCAKGAVVDVTGLPNRGQWLIEPDPAIIRAGAVADLAAAINATLVDDHLAYLSTAAPITDDDRRFRGWPVSYAGPYDPAALRALCTAHGVTRVDLTGRGRHLNPQRVARDLRLVGGPGGTGRLFVLGLGTPRRTSVVLALRSTEIR